MNSICQKVFDVIESMNIMYDLIEHLAVYKIEEYCISSEFAVFFA